MARNLSRNTQLFISTEDNELLSPAPSTANMYEVKVLDGYSFSQDVSNVEIGVSEAGTQPVRGTQGFNTALNPVDVSFSTYVRSYDNATLADCVEKVLWASAMGTAAGWTNSLDDLGDIDADATYGYPNGASNELALGLVTSNNNELMPLTLYFVLENTTYVVQQFNVGTAEVDFSIDGIATINWTGQGSRVNEDQDSHGIITATGFDAGTDYTGVPATQTDTFLRNKLSTLQIQDNEDAATPAVDNIVADTVAVNQFTFTGTSLDSTYLGGRIRSNSGLKWRTIVKVVDATNIIVDDALDGTKAGDDTDWDTALDIFTADQHAGIIYNVPITGATLTLENNYTYLTPEELAIVNLPLAGFAGSRVVSGSLTAYLNTGAEGSGGLLQDMLAKIEQSVVNSYHIKFIMGGNASAFPRVEFDLPTAQLTVPSTSVEDIISTEISFTSKPSNIAGDGTFEDTNELMVSYYKPA